VPSATPSSCTRTTPFDFTLSSEDDGIEPHTSLRLTCPERLDRWKPLYKWFLAIPQYFVLAGLLIAACLGTIAGFFTVLLTGSYPPFSLAA
jgi:hypothetical protein